MTDYSQKFIDCLDDAGQLLNEYPSIATTGTINSLDPTQLKSFDLALFEDWSEFNELEVPSKPPIRLIQHLSCTGGTLIAKCLAGMPNVSILSEVNPLCSLPVTSLSKFAPTDLTYLARQARFPLVNELSEKIFKADIDVISEHLKQLGRYLLLREHSHSDYLVGDSANEISTVRKLLTGDHRIVCILTVRHPVDSYLSLLNNGWVSFAPKTFNEYCSRYLHFLEHNQDSPIFKYEDFVRAPEKATRKMCKALELPFNEDFEDVFDLTSLTGDSGRSSDIISTRKRRDIDDELQKEIDKSKIYPQLCALLSYPPN